MSACIILIYKPGFRGGIDFLEKCISDAGFDLIKQGKLSIFLRVSVHVLFLLFDSTTR